MNGETRTEGGKSCSRVRLLDEWLRARIVLIKIKRVPHHRARAWMSTQGLASYWWLVVWLGLPRNVARLLRLITLAGELTRIRSIVYRTT